MSEIVSFNDRLLALEQEVDLLTFQVRRLETFAPNERPERLELLQKLRAKIWQRCTSDDYKLRSFVEMDEWVSEAAEHIAWLKDHPE